MQDSPSIVPLAVFLCCAIAATPTAQIFFIAAFVSARRKKRPVSRALKAMWAAACLALVFEASCFVWGYLIEPGHLTVTRLTLHTPKIPPGGRIRIVQISDLHTEGASPLIDRVARETNLARPDFILLTGDYLNSERGFGSLLAFLKKLKAGTAIYAAYGNWEQFHDPSLQFGLADIELIDRKIKFHSVRGIDTVIAGLQSPEARAYLNSPHAASTLNIMPTHYPDYIYHVADSHLDYYFCGHTHGGQVRIPGYGALVTFSRYGKRFEGGLYRVGGTTMYVSRGIGVEGATGLRFRFNCPPELVIVDLVR